MTRIVTKVVLTFLLFFISINSYAGNDLSKITMMTETYPPYNMKVDGQLQGIAVDILEEMLKIMDTGQNRDDFILTNWSRAYSMAEKRKNYMVFSTTRTAHREPLFKWVGPITTTTVGLVALKEKGIVINNFSDLKQYRIGTVLKDIGEQVLLQSGIERKQIHSIGGTNCIDLSFKKMKIDRIDMFAYEVTGAMYGAKSSGHNVDDFEIVYTLKEGQLYYAFNIETDDEVINRWQNALDTIKANGRYDEIMAKY